MEAGNGMGIEKVESQWLESGVKGIPGESGGEEPGSLWGTESNPDCLEHPLWGRPGVRGVA